MSSKTKIAIVILFVTLVISGGIFIYLRSDLVNKYLQPLRTKNITLESAQVSLIDNHPVLHVALNDKTKMDQILRVYSDSFPNRYQNLALEITKTKQETSFSWSSGETYGYTLKDDLATKTLNVIFFIGEDTLRNASWDNEQIAKELEYYLLHALERERLGRDPDHAITRTTEEEVQRNDLVESNVDQIYEQLNTDNNVNLFVIK